MNALLALALTFAACSRPSSGTSLILNELISGDDKEVDRVDIGDGGCDDAADKSLKRTLQALGRGVLCVHAADLVKSVRIWSGKRLPKQGAATN